MTSQVRFYKSRLDMLGLVRLGKITLGLVRLGKITLGLVRLGKIRLS
jgi:hypothetical protein